VNTKEFACGYLADLRKLIDAFDPAELEPIVSALFDAWRNGGRVLLMGNGGTSSNVSHIVNDMQKNLFLETGKALRTMCLSDNTPILMAWANDTAWDNVFAPQVECWAEPGDVVIGASGSGNSMNVINGIEAARRAGAKTFGLAGYGGGKLKTAAEHCVVVYSDNMQRVEDMHMIMLHMLFGALMERARAVSAAPAAS
jgi:D-sedoheptulose 7-phosphate isomerase